MVSVSTVAFSISNSESNFAISSSSTSPAFSLRKIDVENGAKTCGRTGFHDDWIKETVRVGLRRAELVSLDAARGAERAMARIDNMILDLESKWNTSKFRYSGDDSSRIQAWQKKVGELQLVGGRLFRSTCILHGITCFKLVCTARYQSDFMHHYAVYWMPITTESLSFCILKKWNCGNDRWIPCTPLWRYFTWRSWFKGLSRSIPPSREPWPIIVTTITALQNQAAESHYRKQLNAQLLVKSSADMPCSSSSHAVKLTPRGQPRMS